MDAAPLVLVHQMAKVGSLTWVEAVRRIGGSPVHSHFLAKENLEAIAATLSMGAEENTIAHPLVARELLRTSRRTSEALETARRDDRPFALVTGVRDPVARSLSVFNFFADFCGHTDGGLSARDGAAPEAVRAMLLSLWEAILRGREPSGSFERLNWLMIGTYRTWFDQELAGEFGLDIFAEPFPHGGGAQRLSAPGIEALAYRAEDMAPTADAEPALRAAAAAFLGMADFSFPRVNTAETRRSWPLYREVRESFRLPLDWLDAIYAVPAVRHFYSPGEIEGFKARWSGSG